MRIGVISDTHGLLRPEVVAALLRCEHILHGGDVGAVEILKSLQAIAPITAIRGNIDEHGQCSHLPATEVVELAGHSIYMLHDLNQLDLNPSAAGFSVVISGHSHKPKIDWKKDVLYFNPGSCGPKRFSLPISLGFLSITPNEIKPELVTL